jgi:hypothetical protein
MAKLEHSDTLGRPIRQEDWDEITISTPEMIKRALREGRRDEALALVDYLAEEKWVWNDHAPEILSVNLTWVARNLGEAELERVMREIPERITTLKRLLMPDVSPRMLLAIVAEQLRALRVPMSIREEPDRFVVESNPCSTCGRLRRTVAEIGHEIPPLAIAEQAHDWTWGKPDVPYYCALSCLWYEIIPIEQRGRPTMITDWDPSPEQPCRKYIYKDPALIPDEYFRRVGKEKPEL